MEINQETILKTEILDEAKIKELGEIKAKKQSVKILGVATAGLAGIRLATALNISGLIKTSLIPMITGSFSFMGLLAVPNYAILALLLLVFEGPLVKIAEKSNKNKG